MPPSYELNAVVSQRIEIAPGLAIFRITPEGWELPEFKPGQFAVLGMPGRAERCTVSDPEELQPDADKLIRRAYSIASGSVAREYIEFYIVLVPSGALTPRLFALEPGDKVWLSPKITGMFTLDQVPADQNVVFISTGTGLAPYMSMLRTHLTAHEPRRYAVLHGARHSWDLGYRSELRTLERVCENLTYVPIISRPSQEQAGWGGQTGYVQSLWERRVLDEPWGFKPSPNNTHVFLCGNPGMIEEIVPTLEKEGFVEHSKKTPGQIHVERYW